MKKILFLFSTISIFAFFLFVPKLFATTCPLTLQKSYKSPDSSSVYYITKDCTKKAFKKADVFFTYFDSWKDVSVVSNAVLYSITYDDIIFMPWGPKYDPKYGALTKTINDSKVYLLLGGKKYWINSADVFNGLNYSWNWIEDVDQRLLDKYQVGSEINYTDHHPNYTVIKYANDPKVYKLQPDAQDPTKQVEIYIQNEAEFNALGFRWDRIVTIENGKTYKEPDDIADNARSFNMLVFIDENSFTISDQELADYFEFSDELFYDRTQTHLALIPSGVWRVKLDEMEDIEKTLIDTLVSNKETFKNANGFVFFSTVSPLAKIAGGHTMSFYPVHNGLGDYCNTFSSYDETDFLYGSIIDWGHKYGICGYNEDGEYVSNTSINGQCRGQAGIECVLKYDYYMCKNLVDEYYATDPRLMSVSTIIHEIMHFFGENGTMDHYGTADCQNYPVPEKTFNCSSADMSGCYFGMCPYTYLNFQNSTNKCDNN
ncbi:MAG: hypothetical protein ABIJ23_01255 [Candidatus Magasanikbacteria bacterium]